MTKVNTAATGAQRTAGWPTGRAGVAEVSLEQPELTVPGPRKSLHKISQYTMAIDIAPALKALTV